MVKSVREDEEKGMSTTTVHPTGLAGDVISLPDGVTIADFQPYAYFDSYMDCIRVMLLDRSVTEERIGDSLTLYRTNHPTRFDAKNCGFCLKGIRYLLDELEIEAGAELALADLIDKIVKRNPQSTMAKILGEFNAPNLMVEWSDSAVAA
jgi:hypothetical protein